MLWTSVNHRLKDWRSCMNTTHCYLSSANTHWLQDGHLETLAQFISVRQAVKTEPGVVCYEFKLNYNPRFCSDLFLVGFFMITISGFLVLVFVTFSNKVSVCGFCLILWVYSVSSIFACILMLILLFLFPSYVTCCLTLIPFCFLNLILHLFIWLPLLAFVYL